MRHYIGIDLSKEVSVVCVQREDGKVIISNALVRTEAAALQAIVNSVPRPRQVTFEESLQAAWIYSVLEPICEKVVVCNPLRNKRLSGEKKSDCADAYNLSDRLRAGILEGVWHGGDNIQRFRELVRAYETLTKDSTRYKLRTDSIFRSRGIKISDSIFDPEKRAAKLLELPLEEQRGRAKLYLETLDLITENRARAEKVLVREAKKSSMYAPLVSLPMIGPLSAAMFIAAVGTPHRFRTKRQFWSYVGLGVSIYETAQYETTKSGNIRMKPRATRTRGLVKEYNRTLKYVIKLAATKLAHADWSTQYLKLVKSGINSSNAKLTLARKLAAIMLHLAKSGEKYDESLVFKK